MYFTFPAVRSGSSGIAVQLLIVGQRRFFHPPADIFDM